MRAVIAADAFFAGEIEIDHRVPSSAWTWNLRTGNDRIARVVAGLNGRTFKPGGEPSP
jgi:hypothetical protein